MTDGKFRNGPAMFYGVNDTNIGVWRECRRAGQEFYFCDNGYFDTGRGSYFRVTRNALQHHGLGRSDGKRFASLGVQIEPWRSGEHVVVCLQSDTFMRIHAHRSSDAIVAAVRSRTKRLVRVRKWSANKPLLGDSLRKELAGAHCLVTWSSASAVQAILSGVPAICLGASAASPMAGSSLGELETPPRPDGREMWAGVLADNQWTLTEIREGLACRATC